VRIKRTIIVPVILALSAAGSIAAGSVMTAAAAAPTAQVLAAAPQMYHNA
jgi:hypothetical protein